MSILSLDVPVVVVLTKCLIYFCRLPHLVNTHGNDTSSWWLTQHGYEQLGMRFGFWIHQPHFALQIREGIDYCQWSAFEKVAFLLQSGWSMRVTPCGRGTKKAKLSTPPYSLELQQPRIGREK